MERKNLDILLMLFGSFLLGSFAFGAYIILGNNKIDSNDTIKDVEDSNDIVLENKKIYKIDSNDTKDVEDSNDIIKDVVNSNDTIKDVVNSNDIIKDVEDSNDIVLENKKIDDNYDTIYDIVLENI